MAWAARRELLDRHQLHRRDAQCADGLDRRRLGETSVGAAQIGRHVRVELREPFHVQLVEDGALGRVPRRTIVAPVVRGVHHERAWGTRGAVLFVDRHLVTAERIREHRRAPPNLARQRPGVRVGQQLRRIAPQPARRIVWAMHPEPIGLAGADAGDE